MDRMGSDFDRRVGFAGSCLERREIRHSMSPYLTSDECDGYAQVRPRRVSSFVASRPAFVRPGKTLSSVSIQKHLGNVGRTSPKGEIHEKID